MRIALASVLALAGCATPPRPTVEFPLPNDVIQATAMTHRREVRECWHAALARQPEARGEVVLAFRIEPTGLVNDLRVARSTVKDAALGTCLVDRIRQWKFPEAKIPTEVAHYPIVFSPEAIQVAVPR